LCEADVNLPWEITDQHIRSGHRSPEEFQPNSLRTIVLSEDEGIKAVAGKRLDALSLEAGNASIGGENEK
jgi:5-methylcytosine-specific restriction endonuclease McrA